MKGPIVLDGKASLEQWPAFAKELISIGTCEQKGKEYFKSAEGFVVGVWEQEANVTAWLTYPCYEVMTLLEGQVAIIEEGRIQVFSAGQTFFIAQGTKCVWSQVGRVRKFFVYWVEELEKDANKKGEVKLLDPEDPNVSFAIFHTNALWKHGKHGHAAGVRAVKKGMASAPRHHEYLHFVEGPEAGKTLLIPASSNYVFPESSVAIYCAFEAKRGNI